MDDPNLGLATRCHICYIRQGIYKCPKCLRRSCSVACIKTHKKRSRCDGIRDPTEPKPLSWLRTPAGIDHDFNFLSNIERSIQRKNQELVEAGLFTEHELRGYNDVEDERDDHGNIVRSIHKDIRKRIHGCCIDVKRVPKGMARERENKTSFCRTNRKGVNWQVEWVLVGVRDHPALDGKSLEGPDTRILHKAIEWKPLFRALDASLEWYRSSLLTADEKEKEKETHERYRRRHRGRGRKRHKIRPDQDDDYEVPEAVMAQNMKTSTWSPGEHLQQDPITGWWNQEMGSPLINLVEFYLHVPQWPSGPKKVLMPLQSTENLNTALCGRTIVEFPTIYVFPVGTTVPFSYEVQHLERKPPGLKRWKGYVEDIHDEPEPEPMHVDHDGHTRGQEQDEGSQNKEIGRGSDSIISGTDIDTSSCDDTTSAGDDDSEDGEVSAGDASLPAQKSTKQNDFTQTKYNKPSTQGAQRGRGRGRRRGWRDNRSGRGGRGGRHPDHTLQREQSINCNEQDSQQHRNQRHGYVRENRELQQGQQSWNHSSGRIMPMPSGVVPQKRASENSEKEGEAVAAKKPKVLVSYCSDSDSGLEEIGAVLQTAAGMDVRRLRR